MFGPTNVEGVRKPAIVHVPRARLPSAASLGGEQPAASPIEGEIPSPLVDAAYGVGGACVGVCAADMIIFELLDLALHRTQCGALRGRCFRGFWLTLGLVRVGIIRARLPLWQGLPPPSPSARAAFDSRGALGAAGRVLGFREAEVHDVGVGEFAPVEAEADLTVLEGCVEALLGCLVRGRGRGAGWL